ncbi:putative thiamine transporter SLC35F3 [Frankliniella occidentalis]|uniref:Thiamine transporter SLC35F3 n=1 Tax=Frankliniella occidentalis TaxID=133901 RepID=A0A6J1S9L6_FRAOC|nr:putative thiamine transporter SLC35F3 [Frankliniella occidentalis]
MRPEAGDVPAIFHPKGRGGGGGGSTGGGSGAGSSGGGGSASEDSTAGQSAHKGPFGQTPRLQHSDSVFSTTAASGHESIPESAIPVVARPRRLAKCKDSCCSEPAKKIYYGVCITICMTASWVGATHSIKLLYLRHPLAGFGYHADQLFPARPGLEDVLPQTVHPLGGHRHGHSNASTTAIHHYLLRASYNAPFFTTWFITNFTIFFFPLYLASRLLTARCVSWGEVLGECVRGFRDRGFTPARFLTRCMLFCLLWVGTNYMYIHSLRILLATDVMALYATNVSCVYLLSWVILHEQFVGVRIVAVILCDTGIALLAYMDGITGSPTLGGVVLAACAGAGSAVYKVLFRKVIGDASYGQVSLFFSLIGLLNASILWPLVLALYLTGAETFNWEQLPWVALLASSALSLVANLLGNFGVAITYDLFITLGLITSVPVSAALDVVLYGAHFAGMKLAGMILIAVGFFLVMLPDNWPDYITRLLRNIILLSHSARWSRRSRHGLPGSQQRTVVDYRTGYIRSHLRSPSGRVR